MRYLSALVVNVAFPWLAYRLAFPHYGQLGALIASALPLIAWMSWGLVRYRHFDALSAIVLVGIVLSLIAMAAGGKPASGVLRYGVYASLTAWTFWCRQRLKQDAMRYPADPADPADATDRLANS